MLHRLGWALAAVVLVLLLLAYAATVLPSLPWWSWPVAVAGVYVIRRWARLRREAPAGETAEGGPLWSPTGRGGY